MKKVYIIGLGIGSKSFIHKKTMDSIEKCTCLIGGKRMIESFDISNKEVFESTDIKEIYQYIKGNNQHDSFGVLVSGDTGFYSLSKKLTETLLGNNESEMGGIPGNQIEIENIPAIGSLQYFSSKLNMSWDNIKYLSAHGRSLNIVSNVIFNEKLFMLTGGELKVNNICRILTDKGLGHLKVSVGENLSYDNERIIEDTAANAAKMKFDSLSVILIHNDDPISPDNVSRSIRDDEFIKGQVPMTKSEVRTLSIGKMNLKNDNIVYDIGAGTGSVSVEAALKLNNGTLYAIEKNKEACSLIQKNIEKFNTYNIEIINDLAPKVLENLPKPDACFIGGSSGKMDQIIGLLLKKNPRVKLVINTITLESLNEALASMKKYKIDDLEIINVSVTKSKKVGSYHMMMGQNPIYIISGRGSGKNENENS